MEDTYKKLEESKQYIRESNEFLYISMAWWWDDYVGRELFKEVEKAHKRNIDIIVIGTGLAGASASATLAELGYNVKAFCFQDSPRRAHSIAAQGGINAAKNSS